VNWQNRVRAVLREPLVHFLLAGLAVFLFFQFRGEAVDPESRSIVVDVATAKQLAARFEQTMQRTPSGKEMDGIIRDYIREEVYYREALRLGLDSEDEVIRRRLRSKMEYLARAEAEAAVPNEATLQAWLDGNAARYAPDALYSFDQIYLGARSADQAFAAMKKGIDWQNLGEAISLPKSMEHVTAADVRSTFGEDFAAALAGQKQKSWVGPIASGFGQHLLLIRAVLIPKLPKLADIRQRVENDWRAQTAATREAMAYQALLDGYTIKIEKP
jgi:peptidyl-prolyl cis-trans isomerase C